LLQCSDLKQVERKGLLALWARLFNVPEQSLKIINRRERGLHVDQNRARTGLFEYWAIELNEAPILPAIT